MRFRCLIYTTENNLEIARTSHDTRKTPLINYVIGNNNNNKKKVFEKKQELLEYAGKLSHCDVRKACELQIYL